MILETIHSPAELKALGSEQLPVLADEIRQKLLATVSKNGGHLASNLCVVELTVALHRVFDAPKDKIIFDVGHQSYVHKLLTGRYENFDTLRRYGGLSGFMNRSESVYDAFGAGHSSTSISAAAGIATAEKLKGSDSFTVAVVGDGSFTGGMIHEALNNCADIDHLIIVLNDNDMSISANVGGMSKYLSRFRSSAKYFRLKNGLKRGFSRIPLLGAPLIKASRAIKNGLKRLLVRQNYFEQLGLHYYGPLDGNDEKRIELVLEEAKNDGKCSVIHICTKKGKGYAPAEERPDLFHGVSGFDIATGRINSGDGTSFSQMFGKLICDRAEKDGRIIAITAAMPDGTGLCDFAKRFPDRFFDVGIAEPHAATFACGLAAGGMIPVFAVYSTFMQRAYDQLLHDAALQGLHVVFMLDRAGLVGADGATHHGIFDAAFTSSIPGVTVYSPDSFLSLEECFDKALGANGPVVVRYPKDVDAEYSADLLDNSGDIAVCDLGGDIKTAVITYGRMTQNVLSAGAIAAQNGVGARIIRLTKIAPLPYDDIKNQLNGIKSLLFVEEGIKNGGIGERLGCLLLSDGIDIDYSVAAIDGVFPTHGKNSELFEYLGLSAERIADKILKKKQ